MADKVELSVRSQLQKIITDLEAISAKSDEISKGFEKAGDDIGDSFNDNLSNTQRFLNKMSGAGRRALGRLTSDFKALISVQGLVTGFKFSEQFKGSIKETLALGDTIRNLGTRFGIARQNFGSFHSEMVKGLGDIGITSDAASKALQGLADQPVEGKDALLEYAKVAGQLGIIGAERGKEGEISKGIAKVITAKGGDASDIKQIQEVAKSLARIREVTGRAPTESLRAMDQLFTTMPENFRKKFSSRMLEGIATAATVGGQNATKFLEKYLSLSDVQRAGLEARGIGDIVTEEGLNLDALKKFAAEAKKLGAGDFRLGMKAMGIEGDQAAEGAIRLVDQIDRLSESQKRLAASTVNLRDMQDRTSSLSQAFAKNLEKVKSVITAPFTEVPQLLTEGLVKASKSGAGAAGVVAGGGVIAALLTGFGLRGVGKAMGAGGGGVGGLVKGLGKATAVEKLTGRDVVPVYVINADEIGGGLMGGVAPGKGGLMSKLGKAGMVAGVAGAGAAAAAVPVAVTTALIMKTAADLHKKEGREGETELGTMMRFLKEVFFEGRRASPGIQRPQETRMVIEDRSGKLQQSGQPSRGASFMGPTRNF